MKNGFLAFLFVFAATAQANVLDSQMAALEKEIAVQTVKQSTSIPTHFNAEKQAAFDKYLEQAIEILNNSGRLAECSGEDCIVSHEELLVEVLVEALYSSMSNQSLEQKILSNDERRAINYAIFTLMMNGTHKEKYAVYRKYLGYDKEWMERNPVENWTQYAKDCRKAMIQFYKLVEELVVAKENGELDRVLHYDTWRLLFH